MPLLELTIHGPPLGKGRPRFATTTGHAYTPTSTVEWEGKARGDVATQLAPEWRRLDGEAVGVFVTAVFDRPERLICRHKSVPRRCKCPPQDARLWFLSTPDGDNVEKITWDALAGAGLFKDDRIVATHAARHFYATAFEPSKVTVEIVWGDDLARLAWPTSTLDAW